MKIKVLVAGSEMNARLLLQWTVLNHANAQKSFIAGGYKDRESLAFDIVSAQVTRVGYSVADFVDSDGFRVLYKDVFDSISARHYASHFSPWSLGWPFQLGEEIYCGKPDDYLKKTNKVARNLELAILLNEDKPLGWDEIPEWVSQLSKLEDPGCEKATVFLVVTSPVHIGPGNADEKSLIDMIAKDETAQRLQDVGVDVYCCHAPWMHEDETIPATDSLYTSCLGKVGVPEIVEYGCTLRGWPLPTGPLKRSLNQFLME